ncbi:MAG: hypothetical protein IPL61_04115 [Myxococcales bacterium]|nr:hypothetical protein [Myxococcales bacterium]
MKHALVFAMIVAVAAGCGKKKDGDAAAKPTEATKPTAPPPPPPPFTGALTIERVMGLDAALGSPPPLALADALARAKGQAGEPTKIDGDRIGWAVVEGDDCAYAYITKSGADQVGGVTKAQKVAKGELPGNRKECLIMAGVDVVPPEDPAAAGPPTDGTAVTVDVFRSTAVAGRSKWKDQVVAVRGLVAGSSTSTSNGDSWTTVSLKASADDADKTVSCMGPKNGPASTATLGDEVIATGAVKINEWTSMGSGDTTLEAALTECAIAAAPAGKKSK